MCCIKCTYFDLPAVGEPIRLLLAYGGEEFEDVRIPMEKWIEIKPSTPFGQVPFYEERGKIINQSLAIMRYLGKKYKLVGNNDWENLEIDAIGDTVMELLFKTSMYHYEQSEKLKAIRKKELYDHVLPMFLERLDKTAENNNGHLAVNKLTWVDFLFAATSKYLSLCGKVDFLKENVNLKAVHDNVMNLPSVIKWYEKNPIPLEETITFMKRFENPTTD